MVTDADDALDTLSIGWVDGAERLETAHGYGGWYDGCCASSGTVDLTTSLRGYTTGAWQTVRIEQDLMAHGARVLLDGVAIFTTTTVPLTSLSTNYVQLRGGGRARGPPRTSRGRT
jgi:hypothetical protein